MKRTLSTFIAIASLAAIAPAAAFTTNIPSQGLPSAADYASKLMPEREGVVSWKTLAKVEPASENGKMVTRFDPAIAALDRKDVRVQGFMLPMDLGDHQHHFLISAVPPHCPFCLPAGPDEIIEVKAAQPVAYAIEPIVLAGRFVVVKDDSYGLLYQLVDAKPVR